MEGKEFWYDQSKGTWMEEDVEKLYTNLRKFSNKQVEDVAIKIFENYINGIGKRK